jgi:hypothetical protein
MATDNLVVTSTHRVGFLEIENATKEKIKESNGHVSSEASEDRLDS